jgi:subtilisin family serine protease
MATGAPVVVAVIDSGVDLKHPDLAPNAWTNRDEIPGNHRDDDHNGFVDDRHGYDFVNDDAQPNDALGHGTHVAGVLAARGDNHLGISGVAQRARIMALRVLDARGYGDPETLARAIRYAAANGARVANLSIGNPILDPELAAAIAEANRRGMLIVVSAGNGGVDLGKALQYPACSHLPNVITVAATGPSGRLASFSNFGSCVDIAAPGTAILGTTPHGRYARYSGTSAAAPQVSGAAVLALARRPHLSVARLASALRPRLRARAAHAGLIGRLNVAAVVRRAVG